MKISKIILFAALTVLIISCDKSEMENYIDQITPEITFKSSTGKELPEIIKVALNSTQNVIVETTTNVDEAPLCLYQYRDSLGLRNFICLNDSLCINDGICKYNPDSCKNVNGYGQGMQHRYGYRGGNKGNGNGFGRNDTIRLRNSFPNSTYCSGDSIRLNVKLNTKQGKIEKSICYVLK